MKFLEKDLETIIYETPHTSLEARGLWCANWDNIYRQVNLGSYGIADLITIKNCGRVNGVRKIIVSVYELKQKQINAGTFLQALGYVSAINNLILPNIKMKRVHFVFDIILIGADIETSGNFPFLFDFTHSVQAYTYSYGFDGIRFKAHHGYYKSSTTLPESTSNLLPEIYHCWLQGAQLDRIFEDANMKYVDARTVNAEDLPF